MYRVDIKSRCGPRNAGSSVCSKLTANESIDCDSIHCDAGWWRRRRRSWPDIGTESRASAFTGALSVLVSKIIHVVVLAGQVLVNIVRAGVDTGAVQTDG